MEAQQPRCPLAAVDLLHCRGGPEAPCNDGLDARIHAAHSTYTSRIRRAGAQIQQAFSADGSRDRQ